MKSFYMITLQGNFRGARRNNSAVMSICFQMFKFGLYYRAKNPYIQRTQIYLPIESLHPGLMHELATVHDMLASFSYAEHSQT